MSFESKVSLIISGGSFSYIMALCPCRSVGTTSLPCRGPSTLEEKDFLVNFGNSVSYNKPTRTGPDYNVIVWCRLRGFLEFLGLHFNGHSLTDTGGWVVVVVVVGLLVGVPPPVPPVAQLLYRAVDTCACE